MTIESQIFSRAVASSAVTALLGTGPTRFYPKKAPEAVTRPYVVYQLLSEVREQVMGVQLENVNSLWQMVAWSDRLLTSGAEIGAAPVALAVREAFTRWREAGPLEVEDSWPEQVNDLYDEATDRDGRAVQVRIFYKE